MSLDVARIRKDFPILDRTVRGDQPLIYLDSANTSQKPRQVIDTLTEFYERHNANIHRASHQLGEEATEAYEGARLKVGQLLGAADETEIVFTKNISEAINLVAYSMSNASAVGVVPARKARRVAGSPWARATRSSSPRWSTTPTSCRGSCCASAPARRCAGSA
jgi:selenocysteine lyase/cysteine desulfurase